MVGGIDVGGGDLEIDEGKSFEVDLDARDLKILGELGHDFLDVGPIFERNQPHVHCPFVAIRGAAERDHRFEVGTFLSDPGELLLVFIHEKGGGPFGGLGVGDDEPDVIGGEEICGEEFEQDDRKNHECNAAEGGE